MLHHGIVQLLLNTSAMIAISIEMLHAKVLSMCIYHLGCYKKDLLLALCNFWEVCGRLAEALTLKNICIGYHLLLHTVILRWQLTYVFQMYILPTFKFWNLLLATLKQACLPRAGAWA